MYWRHFDLSAEPFSLTPDPAFLYLSTVHAEAYAALMVGLRERRGLIAMIGEVGTGKTTLVYSLLSALGPDIHTAYISNARLSFDGILRTALRDFSVESDSVHSTDLLDAFNRFLNQCAQEGSTAAVVIDEAQNLSRDTFEDLRLLTNFETYKQKLLQIVLVGQPELDTKLRDPSLRQVADRIAVRCHVNPLTPHEVRQYLQHRLSAAGGSIEIFSEAAVRTLVHHSRGIPRSINILGHNAMLFAYGSGRTRVSRRDVKSAVRERQGRGLVRFEARLPRVVSRRADSGTRVKLSYPQLLLGGVAAGLIFFALGASGAKLLRDSGSGSLSPATAPAVQRAPKALPARDVKAPAGGERARAAERRRDDASVANDTAQKKPTASGQAVAPAPSATNGSAADRDAEASSTRDDTRRALPGPAADELRARPDGAAEKAAAPEPQSRAQPSHPSSANGAPVATTQAPANAPQQPAMAAAPNAPSAPNEASVASAASAPSSVPTLAPAAEIVVSAPAQPAAPNAGAQAPANAAAGDQIRETHVGPDLVRVIQVSPGTSLYDLMTSIYGVYDPRYVPRIQAMNPQMKDPNYIMAGDELRFPEDLSEEIRKQPR